MDRLFVDLRKRVDREARNQRQLLMLRGSLELILTGSRARERPALRAEEKMLRRELMAGEEGENGKRAKGVERSGLDLSLERVLLGL